MLLLSLVELLLVLALELFLEVFGLMKAHHELFSLLYQIFYVKN